MNHPWVAPALYVLAMIPDSAIRVSPAAAPGELHEVGYFTAPGRWFRIGFVSELERESWEHDALIAYDPELDPQPHDAPGAQPCYTLTRRGRAWAINMGVSIRLARPDPTPDILTRAGI